MKQKTLIILFMGILLSMSSMMKSQTINPEPASDKLVVVWTSGDPMVAERVALMYTHAAKTSG